MRTRGRWRQRLTAPNPGYLVVLSLCVLTVISVILGLALQPAASAPAPVPDPPGLNLIFQSGAPLRLFVYSFLKQASAGRAELVIEATGTFAARQVSTRWSVGILAFTGYLCRGQSPAISLVPVRNSPHGYEINGRSAVPATDGRPFLVIGLCWAGGSPLISDGAYISAALSPVTVASGQSGTVTRSLVLGGTSLSGYSLAGGIAPTEVTARSWIWTGNLSGSFDSQAGHEIPIIASSLPGIQRDNQDVFYSGILFGVAGGAAVSVIPALLDASDRRRGKGISRCRQSPVPASHEQLP